MYVGLYFSGNLSGSVQPSYSKEIVLYDAVKKVDLKFKNTDDMFIFFYSKYENMAQFKDLLFVYGLDENTLSMFDKRTIEFYEAYSFFKNNPEKAYSQVYYVWYKVYSLINRIITNNTRVSQWL